MLKRMTRTMLLAAAATLAAIPADASILIVSAPTITMNGPADFTWDYEVFLSAGSELLPPGTACATTIVGGICDGLLTIYDFNGYIGGSISTTAAGWSNLIPVAMGPTPLGLTPADGAALNLAWAYTGSTTVVAGSTPLLLGTFSGRSTFGNASLTDYTGRSATRIAGSATRSANLDSTLAPIDVQSAIPEPGTVFLLGAALLGLAWFRSEKDRAN
jgi:hypothetical protein